MTTPTVNNIYNILVFKIFIAKLSRDFYYFNLLRFYCKYLNIKLLYFHVRSINPIQKYSHIIEWYACIL